MLILTLLTGLIAGAILASLVWTYKYWKDHAKDAYKEPFEVVTKELEYLRSRIRGFQIHATRHIYGGERKYLVQEANGKFCTAYLPNMYEQPAEVQEETT